jgi:hypothetical protein
MKDEVADVDLVLVFNHQWAGNLAPIDVGAVGALQIDDDELAIFDDNAGVPLRDVSLGQDDVIALDTPNVHLGLVELKATLLSTLFRDDNREHCASSKPASPRGEARFRVSVEAMSVEDLPAHFRFVVSV